MSLTLTGRIKTIMPETVISEKFKKREFVLTDESSQYPQHLLFQMVNDKSTFLNKFKEGDVITVHFNLRGREWTSPANEVKYFNTLEAWRLEASATITPTNETAAKTGKAMKPQAEFAIDSPAGDDLPF